MTMAILLCTLWHWAPPTTGTPSVEYLVRQRDAWGDSISAWTVPDTMTTVTYEPLPYRLEVAGVDSLGRRGPWSLPSAVYIPPRWRDLFYAMGVIVGNKGLSMTTAAAVRLDNAWPKE